MTRYNLTTHQEALLTTLVSLTNEGKLKDPIVPIPIRNSKTNHIEYVLHLTGEDSFRFTNISDLDVLNDAGLLSFRWNRHGIGKLYSITRAGAAAVQENFEQPFSPPGPRYRPDLIVRAMAGALDGQRYDNALPDIDQITADPILLHTTVEQLESSLLETMHQQLNGPLLLTYARTLREFKDAIYNGRLAPKELQFYARQLAGMDIQYPLLLEAWPYLYPLLLIAEKRIATRK